MFSFCPHCGESIGQEQAAGQTIVCRHCGHTVGVIPKSPVATVVDQTEELIRQGSAARCATCQQAVEVKVRGTVRSLVPHAARGEPRKMCPGGGKTIQPPKDDDRFRKYMTTDVIQVIRCGRTTEPTIEELTLDYLDKSDRVRLQIDAVRELLGASFRMQDYPPTLNQPALAVWRSEEACVIAKKHPQGGYQAMSSAEIAAVLSDIRQARGSFFI